MQKCCLSNLTKERMCSHTHYTQTRFERFGEESMLEGLLSPGSFASASARTFMSMYSISRELMGLTCTKTCVVPMSSPSLMWYTSVYHIRLGYQCITHVSGDTKIIRLQVVHWICSRTWVSASSALHVYPDSGWGWLLPCTYHTVSVMSPSKPPAKYRVWLDWRQLQLDFRKYPHKPPTRASFASSTVEQILPPVLWELCAC